VDGEQNQLVAEKHCKVKMQRFGISEKKEKIKYP
jgi:hypothetical protein